MAKMKTAIENERNNFDDSGYFFMKQFPPASVNNSRAIVFNKLVKMTATPSERTARLLENMADGLDVDYLGGYDEGEGPKE